MWFRTAGERYSPALVKGVGHGAGSAAGVGGATGTAAVSLKMSLKELARPGVCANKDANLLFMGRFLKNGCRMLAGSRKLSSVGAPVGDVEVVGDFVFAYLCVMRT